MIGKTINEEIVLRAITEIGQEEIKGNQGFKDPLFQQRMEAVGFQLGNAWCALFCELIWEESYQNWDATMFGRLKKLFSASAVTTFRNFQKAKDFIVNRKFEPGCLCVWQVWKDGKAHWTGHIAIGIKENKKLNQITTIDGNTNDAGGREGYVVAEKTRIVNFNPIQNGKVLLGFIHPKKV